MVDLDGDLAAIFAGADLDQVNAVFVTTGGNVTARGFFTGPTESVSMLDGQIEANDPTFACKTVDVAAVRNENAVTISSTGYTVKRKHNLGAGMTLIYLKS